MSLVQIRVGAKRYHEPPITVLDGVELAIDEGSVVAVVGPSGAGKTTLLNLIAGLDCDYEGELRVGGRVCTDHEHHELSMGYVFQTPRLMPWLSLLDNVMLVMPRNAEQTRAEAVALLQQVGLSDFEHAYPAQLSGGMQRRAGLARALAARPRLLLMDEPFISLDNPTAWRLRSELLAWRSESQATIVYVTHDLREALAMADRVVLLSSRPGRIVLDESVRGRVRHDPDDPVVSEMHRLLVARYPDLLSGLTGVGPAARDSEQTGSS
jgi:NitT/TauT family transport system ATP-binding protein